MYRIRFHGRGGQGMKTASRILGTAFFREGFEVQDAPRYGAERRGAPIFAYVRAGRAPIHERGVIDCPDLVVVADDSLVPVAAAGVLHGVDDRTVLLFESDTSPDEWRRRLNHRGPVVTLPRPETDRLLASHLGPSCAGAAARLIGVIGRETLAAAIEHELAGHPPAVVASSREHALAAYDGFSSHAGAVAEGADEAILAGPPDWVELPREAARLSAPDIHAAATSVEVRTGLWRTMRPVIDREICRGCSWICSTFCPDGAITIAAEASPHIDYDYCKGCLVCVAVCPAHAIHAIPETQVAEPHGTGSAP